MKKILVLLVSIILVTGCGAKKENITCTKSNETMGIVSNLTVKYELYKHQINKLDFSLDIKIDEKYREAYLNELNKLKDEYYNNYGISSNVEETSAGYKLVFTLNAKESSDFYKKYSGSSEDAVYTIKSIKENGEKLGFTCKEE